MTRFSPFLWIALAFLLVVWAVLLRYEPIPDNVLESASIEKTRYVVWDRWQRRLCVAFLGREELACTPDELRLRLAAWKFRTRLCHRLLPSCRLS
jgi:hypothetical protein